jgi:hypothetical protein
MRSPNQAKFSSWLWAVALSYCHYSGNKFAVSGRKHDAELHQSDTFVNLGGCNHSVFADVGRHQESICELTPVMPPYQLAG